MSAFDSDAIVGEDIRILELRNDLETDKPEQNHLTIASRSALKKYAFAGTFESLSGQSQSIRFDREASVLFGAAASSATNPGIDRFFPCANPRNVILRCQGDM
jgi:hypothetical protein